jgi:hypothetical protein
MDIANVTQQLNALTTMRLAALRQRYAEVFGEGTASRNAAYLRKKVAWRLQELAEGGLSERARQRILDLAHEAPIRYRPPRPKSGRPQREGQTLRRWYKGVEHVVVIHEDGFEYRGTKYPSLTKIAEVITGKHFNGRRFFGVAPTHRRDA